jgi:hypothetical protein
VRAHFGPRSIRKRLIACATVSSLCLGLAGCPQQDENGALVMSDDRRWQIVDADEFSEPIKSIDDPEVIARLIAKTAATCWIRVVPEFDGVESVKFDLSREKSGTWKNRPFPNQFMVQFSFKREDTKIEKLLDLEIELNDFNQAQVNFQYKNTYNIVQYIRMYPGFISEPTKTSCPQNALKSGGL